MCIGLIFNMSKMDKDTFLDMVFVYLKEPSEDKKIEIFESYNRIVELHAEDSAERKAFDSLMLLVN